MRLFPLHILVKDLSFLMIYFIIMRYNLTNETYLPETIANFHEAPEMNLFGMIVASLYINLVPLIISFIVYYPVVLIIRKIISVNTLLRIIVTGIILSVTTPLFYFWPIGWKHNDYFQNNAEIIAWILTFVISNVVYFVLNKNNRPINTQ